MPKRGKYTKEREAKTTSSNAIVGEKRKAIKTRHRATPLDVLVLPKKSPVHVFVDVNCVLIQIVILPPALLVTPQN